MPLLSRALRFSLLSLLPFSLPAAANGVCDVLFVGDSITDFWDDEGRGLAVWRRDFAAAPYFARNAGHSGFRTESTLAQLAAGDIDGCPAKVVVLMLGTNNTGHRSQLEESPTDTALGVAAVVRDLRKRLPDAKILLHAIFPRGEKSDDPLRLRNDLVNIAIRGLADDKHVFWCDINARFLDKQGNLSRDIMPDLLHPAEKGYEIWSAALRPYLEWLLGRAERPAAEANEPRAFRTWPNVSAVVHGAWCQSAVPSRYWHFEAKEPRLAAKRRQIRENKLKTFDIVFMGDSITHGWDTNGKDVLAGRLGRYNILNAGFGGDCVEQLIWNLEFGGFADGYTTPLGMMMIGTNNGETDPAEIARGIRRAIDTFFTKQPNAKLILIPIFPRGDKADHPWRLKNEKINAIIRAYADGERILWCDFGAKFLDKQGAANVDLMPDRVHPTKAGYEIWADAVEPIFKQVLGM